MITTAEQEEIEELANIIFWNKTAMNKLEKEFDAAWARVLEILGPEPFEYQTKFGKLAYVKRGGEPELTERDLLHEIQRVYPESWREIWLTITDEQSDEEALLVRPLNQDRLADLMREGLLQQDAFIKPSKTTYARTQKAKRGQ